MSKRLAPVQYLFDDPGAGHAVAYDDESFGSS
jgi:hypothetical protein